MFKDLLTILSTLLAFAVTSVVYIVVKFKVFIKQYIYQGLYGLLWCQFFYCEGSKIQNDGLAQDVNCKRLHLIY